MNPKQFLLFGGIVLVVVGILGFVGVLGPTSDDSIFGSAWWFDNGENWAHLLGGVVAIVARYLLSAGVQKTLTLLVGVVAIIGALYGFLVGENFLGANFQQPLDNILHLVVAVWAFLAWRKSGQMPAMGGMSNQPMGGAPMGM